MFSAIIILVLLPLVSQFKINSNKVCKIYQFWFWLFIFNFIFLGFIGARVVEAPYVLLGQISTCFYFMYFLIVLPILNILENSIKE